MLQWDFNSIILGSCTSFCLERRWICCLRYKYHKSYQRHTHPYQQHGGIGIGMLLVAFRNWWDSAPSRIAVGSPAMERTNHVDQPQYINGNRIHNVLLPWEQRWFYCFTLHVFAFWIVLTTSVSFFRIVGRPSAKFEKWIDIGSAKLGTIKQEATSRQPWCNYLEWLNLC